MNNPKTFAMMFFAIGFFAIGALLTPAWADYQVSGQFLYKDREFGVPNGFTGIEPDLPIREADVEVLDANTQAVLATGVTDQTGAFSMAVIDNQIRNLTVRVLSSSTGTPDLFLTVRDTNTSAVFAVAHPVFSNHDPGTDIDFTATPVVAVQSAGGDAFNIFDVVLDGLDFVATLNGSRPTSAQALTLYWRTNSSNGTYYQHANRSIYLLGLSSDSDAYDDSVILHELGHYVEFTLADSDNPGGFHQLNGCYDLRLAWSEGWSTFFQSTVRQWKGLNRPDIYVDTSGAPGPGGAFIAYGIETIPAFVVNPGSGNEVSVSASLWDIVDTASDLDATPGSDDDALQLLDGPARTWDVLHNYIPLASRISIEDFWDGWFVQGYDSSPEMISIFQVFNMEFFDDSFETDDSWPEARYVIAADATTHHTLHGSGDEDWTGFIGTTGASYSIQASNVPCGGATLLRLYDADGTTLLASNNSVINWVAAKNGPLFVRVTHPGPDTYSNYDLTIDVPVDVVQEHVEVVPERLRLFPAKPNPFNPRTTLEFTLPRDARVFVEIFNVSGRRVRTLVNGAIFPAGHQSISWDGLDEQGRSSASGVYKIRFNALGRTQLETVVLVR